MTRDGRPLRVLHLRTSDRFGGPERLILEQARRASSGVKPVVASFGRTGAPHAFLDAVAATGVETLLVAQEGSYDPRAAIDLKRAIARLQPDVVVGHDYKADLALALAGRDRPRVAVVHGYTGEDAKIRFFEAVDRRLLRSMRAVVVVSELLREQLVASGVEHERIRLVPNGIDADRVAAVAHGARVGQRRAWGVADGDRLLLALGRLSPEKGQDLLLEAFAATRRPGETLVLVGDGASREDLEALVRTADLEDCVTFLGWRDDPWACLGAADLLVLPSRTEGLPLALLEGMAVGVPVVATDVGEVGTVLEHGAHGLVVPAQDLEALGAALRAVQDDPDAARLRARSAAQHVRDRYSVEAQARTLESIYASLG